MDGPEHVRPSLASGSRSISVWVVSQVSGALGPKRMARLSLAGAFRSLARYRPVHGRHGVDRRSDLGVVSRPIDVADLRPNPRILRGGPYGEGGAWIVDVEYGPPDNRVGVQLTRAQLAAWRAMST